MTMPEEKERLEALIGAEFLEESTQIVWTVCNVKHNIYKDVVLELKDDQDNRKSLIEGSYEYYRKFKKRES